MAEVFPDEGLDLLLNLIRVPGTPLPSTLYLGIFVSPASETAVPAASAVLATSTGVTEAVGTSYARVALAAASWGAIQAGGGGRQITFPEVTFPVPGSGGWGTGYGWFIANAITAGKALCYSNNNGGGVGSAIALSAGADIKITPTLGLNG